MNANANGLAEIMTARWSGYLGPGELVRGTELLKIDLTRWYDRTCNQTSNLGVRSRPGAGWKLVNKTMRVMGVQEELTSQLVGCLHRGQRTEFHAPRIMAGTIELR